MKAPSPTLEGFRATFYRPALGTAEIAWRWTFGTALSLLLALSFLAYLDTLPVTNADLLFLRTRQPFLIAQAVGHILRGSGLRFVLAGIVLFVGLSICWVLVSSFGRAASLKWLLDYFAVRSREWAPVLEVQLSGQKEGWSFRSLAGLNVVRVASTLAAVIACMGVFIATGLVSSAKNPHPGLAFLLFFPLICLVWLSWSTLNWFFSLASVFVVRDRQDTFGAVSAAVKVFRERIGPIIAVSFWFGAAHLTAFFLATTVVSLPLALAGVAPPGVVIIGILVVTLVYFAVVDWLYAGRLAGYVAIIEGPEVPPRPPMYPQMPVTPAPSAASHPTAATPAETRTQLFPPIPPSDDDILSDVPSPPSTDPST